MKIAALFLIPSIIFFGIGIIYTIKGYLKARKDKNNHITRETELNLIGLFISIVLLVGTLWTAYIWINL